MKTQVIHVENYDSLPSVLDKISQVEAYRLILVDNPNIGFMIRKSAIVQILRACGSRGIQLGMVSKRYDLIAICGDYGITVFDDLTSAQYQDWNENLLPRVDGKRTKNKKPLEKPENIVSKPENPLIRWIFFSLAIIAVLVLLISVIPSATIIVDTPAISDRVSYPIRFSPNNSIVSVTSGVPSVYFDHTDEIVLSQSVNDKTLLPAGFATGSVIFTNLTEISGVIPKGTIISTLGDSPILFITTDDLPIEGKRGFQVSGMATAVEPGENGNVSGGMIQQIQAILPFQAEVSNPESFSGGSSEMKNIAGISDRNSLRENAILSLKEIIIRKISDDTAGDYVIFPNTYKLMNIIREEFYPPEGNPGDTLTIHLTATGSIEGIKKEDLLQYFSELAKLDLSREVIAGINLESIDVTCSDATPKEDYACQISGERLLSRSIDEWMVKRLVMGKTPKQAEKAIRNYFPEVNTVSIDIKPNGWFIIPLATYRVKVEDK